MNCKWELVHLSEQVQNLAIATVGDIEVGAIFPTGGVWTAMCYLPFGRKESKAMEFPEEVEAQKWLEARVNEWADRWAKANP